VTILKKKKKKRRRGEFEAKVKSVDLLMKGGGDQTCVYISIAVLLLAGVAESGRGVTAKREKGRQIVLMSQWIDGLIRLMTPPDGLMN
jgi:hypothetical protein